MVNNDRKLDYIIDEMVNTVENSKDEVFGIAEESRKEYELLTEELASLKHSVLEKIRENEQLDKQSALSRQHLAEVSKNFRDYSEDTIKEAYDRAHKYQTALQVNRDKEQILRKRRDEIELRLKSMEHMVERADGLAGKISIVLNYLNDDFKHVSDIIQDAHAKQQFGLKIIEAQEEERRRISREIHDGPAQMLANIMLRSEIVGRTYKKGDVESAVSEMRNVRSLIKDSLHEVRRIIYDLRPMALDDLGLIPTIKKYISTLHDQHANIHFSYNGSSDRLDSQYEVALFRLIQESIQNAIKHAEADQIKVLLEVSAEKVIVLVEDDGEGFDQNQKKEKSFGLIGMQERVEMLEGEIRIKSQIAKGTKIMIKIPIKQNIDTDI
ncbi:MULTISPECIES: sensor histidine kinase [Gracilibacillus]|uniref:sensor histidine kinase n=1 Tax=Gracilibacillus TaxID=74385 RepID=UPI000824CDBC|nr:MULTISPECIES: sensor histidine kinase [Gracilibacillus]